MRDDTAFAQQRLQPRPADHGHVIDGVVRRGNRFVRQHVHGLRRVGPAGIGEAARAAVRHQRNGVARLKTVGRGHVGADINLVVRHISGGGAQREEVHGILRAPCHQVHRDDFTAVSRHHARVALQTAEDRVDALDVQQTVQLAAGHTLHLGKHVGKGVSLIVLVRCAGQIV